MGDGTTADKSEPTQENSSSTDWVSVSGGGYHTVAIKDDGTLWSWGNNQYGQVAPLILDPTLSQPRE